MIQIRLTHLVVLLAALTVSVFLLAPTGVNHGINQEDIGIVNANRYGAAYTHTTLSAAIAGLSGTRGTIALSPKGTWAISGNVTVPSTATLLVPNGTTVNITGSSTLTINGGLRIESGGYLCAAVGSTVAINGPIDAPVTQVFCQTGSIVFTGNNKVDRLYPQWWGAVADNMTDSTIPIRLAINSQTTQELFFPPGYYVFTDQIFIDNPHCVHIKGSAGLGGNTVFRRHDTMAGFLFVIRGAGCAIENIAFYDFGTDVTKSGGIIYLTGIDLTNRAGNIHIDNIRMSSSAAGGAWEYGLYINGGGLRTAGTQGVRDIFVSNSQFFGTRVPRRTIFMDTCVHCFFTNVSVVGAPTSITQGVYIQGWDGATNWTEGVYFTNTEILGDFYAEGRNIIYMGGELGQSQDFSAPTINVPATSYGVQIISLLQTTAQYVSNSGVNSYILGHETPGGSIIQRSSFPTGGARIPGFVITGSGIAPDYQGITRLNGPTGYTPIANIMAGQLGDGSTWEFGVSSNYGSGVNETPFTIDKAGAKIQLEKSLRFDGAHLANLSGLIGSSSVAITWCVDCAQGSDPCTGGFGSFAVFNGAHWICPVWP